MRMPLLAYFATSKLFSGPSLWPASIGGDSESDHGCQRPTVSSNYKSFAAIDTVEQSAQDATSVRDGHR